MSKLFRTFLEWVLITSLVLSAYLFIRFYFESKQLRTYSAEMMRYQNTHTFLNALGSDCLEYSKTHPDLEPILEMIGVRQPGHTAPGPKPAAK